MGRDSRIALVRIGADDRGFRSKLRETEKGAQAWATRAYQPAQAKDHTALILRNNPYRGEHVHDRQK